MATNTPKIFSTTFSLKLQSLLLRVCVDNDFDGLGKSSVPPAPLCGAYINNPFDFSAAEMARDILAALCILGGKGQNGGGMEEKKNANKRCATSSGRF